MDSLEMKAYVLKVHSVLLIVQSPIVINIKRKLINMVENNFQKWKKELIFSATVSLEAV